MAVPTFTSVTPTSGHAGGRVLVSIAGTNFRVPSIPPAGPAIPRPVPVRVRFDGEAALRVDVISTTLLEVLTPSYRGAPAADPIVASAIELANLDDAGVLIPGEVVTAAAAFTYQRLGIRAPASLQAPAQVIRELVAMLRRQVLPNTRIVPHTDYAEPGAARTLFARLPGVYLSEFRLLDEDRARADPNTFRNAEGPVGTFSSFYPSFTQRLECVITGVSDSMTELMQLATTTRDAFHRTPFLTVDITDGAGPRYQYQLDPPDNFAFGIPPSPANIRAFSGSIAVRDVAMELTDPVSRQAAVALIQVETGAFDGAVASIAVETTQF